MHAYVYWNEHTHARRWELAYYYHTTMHQKIRFNEVYCKGTVSLTFFTTVFHHADHLPSINWLINTSYITFPGQPGNIWGVINLIFGTGTGDITYIVYLHYLTKTPQQHRRNLTSVVCETCSVFRHKRFVVNLRR